MKLHSCPQPLEHLTFPDAALEGSIHERFARQVERHADCVAIRDRGASSITYGELDRRSSGVAAAVLGELGRRPEPVPLLQRQGCSASHPRSAS